MNDKEKEHLKEFMGWLLEGFLHDQGYRDIKHAEVSDEYNTILSLIDRQETGDEAVVIKDWLSSYKFRWPCLLIYKTLGFKEEEE